MPAPNFTVPANVAEELKKTAAKYRADLITMPTRALAHSLQYMTLRPGLRVSETVTELIADAQLGPYDESRRTNADVELKPRTLEVFLGNVVQQFSPNSVYSTIWGANATHGEALKNVPIALQVLQLLALKLGQNLDKVLFSAVRNASGTTSAALFNGFDTIAAKEKTDNNLTTALGNLVTIDQVDDDNAVDIAQAICESADELLLDQELNLIVPRSFMFAYNRAYLKKFGMVPYNQQYQKTFVEGFPNVTIAPLGNKKDSPFIQLTSRSNMLVGVNEAQDGTQERIDIEKYDPYLLPFVPEKFFGVEYESINKERLLVATVDGTAPVMKPANA